MNAPGRETRQWRVLVTVELHGSGIFSFRATDCEELPLCLEPVRGAPPGSRWFNILIDARLNASQYESSARRVVGMLHRYMNEGIVSRFHVVDGNQWLLDRYCA